MAAAVDLAGAEALVVVTSSSTSPKGEPAHVGLQELAVVGGQPSQVAQGQPWWWPAP